jgi:hypothetical protein
VLASIGYDAAALQGRRERGVIGALVK